MNIVTLPIWSSTFLYIQLAASNLLQSTLLHCSVNMYTQCCETLFYCGHCDFNSVYKQSLKRHMERIHSHTQVDEDHHTVASEETVQCNDLVEAIEVWKIYKFLQE